MCGRAVGRKQAGDSRRFASCSQSVAKTYREDPNPSLSASLCPEGQVVSILSCLVLAGLLYSRSSGVCSSNLPDQHSQCTKIPKR